MYAVVANVNTHTIMLNNAFIPISKSDTSLYLCHGFLEQMTIVYVVTGVRHSFDIRQSSYGRCHVSYYVRESDSVIPHLLFDVKHSGKILQVQYRKANVLRAEIQSC